MKRTLFFIVALLALAALPSCQKEPDSGNAGIREFTGGIEQPLAPGEKSTKTSIENIHITWCADDEITVTDDSGATAVYAAQSDGPSTAFTYKSGDAVGAPPFYATYGNINNQKYSAVGANCPLAAISNTTDFQFSSPYAIVRILAASDEPKYVRSVTVAGITLDCEGGVELNPEPKYFYVAIGPHEYPQLTVRFRANDGTEVVKKRTSEIMLNANELLCLPEFRFFNKDWKPIPAGALLGKFSVDGEGRQVYFSQGNLYYEDGLFKFESNQCDSTPSSDVEWESNHISHFYWSQSAEEAIKENYGDFGSVDDVFFTNATETTAREDFVVNVGGEEQKGWRTLSKDEWSYLFSAREVNGENGEDHSYSLNIKYGGKMGLVLYPDDYDKNPISGEVENLPEGVVFFPAAGYRFGSNVFDVGDYGYYWSSTACDSDSAYRVGFDSSNVHLDRLGTRDVGCSVRLVTDVK